MAFFDEFKDKAMDLAQTGIAKSKQLAEMAKLKAANLSEEDSIKKAYIEIGKLYYAERGMAPEAAFAALCEKITACKVNVEENNARIEALKQEGVEDADVASADESCCAAPADCCAAPTDCCAEKPAAPVEPLADDTKPQDPQL